MATIYFPSDDKVLSLLKQVVGLYHSDLAKAKVEFGVTFALAGGENQPALKEHGQPAFGLLKIISPADRRKGIDVELYLDGDEWGRDAHETQVAKLDHLLQRLEVRKPKPKKKKRTATHGNVEETQEHEESEFLLDGAGKPLLRRRKPDLYLPVGFRDVIERHGQRAPEYIAAEAAMLVAKNARQFHEAPVDEEPAEQPVVAVTDGSGVVEEVQQVA